MRLWTDAAGANLPGFIYYPFGKQLNSTVNDEQMRFTGHERDLWNTASANDDLDYMHARHYNPQLGRFLQIDPLAGSVRRPQTLNRYAYVSGNPLSRTDPTGRLQIEETIDVIGEDDCPGQDPGLPCPGNSGGGGGGGGSNNPFAPTEPGQKATPYYPGTFHGDIDDESGGGVPTTPTSSSPSDPPPDEDPPDEEPPGDPPGEKCAELSPAQARYLNSWNSYDSTLDSMLSHVGAAAPLVNGHMMGTAQMYSTGLWGAGALGYGLQVSSTAPVSLIVGTRGGFLASRIGQALFRPGSFLNYKRTLRIGISQNATSWTFRAAGTKVGRWAKPNGHLFDVTICPK